ncbi:AGAP006066-PA-like protein [Anopheles sinensis]|uniref:AGAP006066-PA-like protein n=1 Tax=Anopheles sinensis TaxID=74873 RepID=A0A084W469_ANOSI|nr:AGAP006066-PA-like protein [Anopheles sinensis]
MVYRHPAGRAQFLSAVGFPIGLLLLCCSGCISPVQCLPKVFRSNDICGVYNGHRVYFELGDRGQLQATNVTVPYLPRAALVNQTTPNVCTLELVTCPSCNFKISLSYSNFPAKCAVHNEPPCRCDYLEFTEPPFDSTEYTGRRNCGHDVVYQTQTRSVLIKFVYWSNHSHAFTLDYVAERNRETIQANPGPAPNVTSINNYLHHRIIATPYFPSYYPRDFGKEYVLSCNVEACRINVIFSDFQLAKTSTMEFYDWNGQRLGAVSGAIFRPPVIQSTGPSMIIRFYANGGSGLGYRALVSFLNIDSSAEESLHPNTNCGGVVENIGGAITMMKMLDGSNDTRVFDCVWLIKPPNTYAHLKTHLSLKVDTFEKLGPHSMLTIIQGTTSDGTVLSVTKVDGGLAKKDLVVPLTSGFYVHLRATFGQLSRLALVYAGFSYLDCYMGTEFLCQNRKCIPIQLHCDGFDHCGDESDEPESCVQEWAGEPIDRRWYSHTPNYYFPKMDHYPDLRTATIIFIASSLGLIMLISALIVLLYRTGSRARHQRELQSQLQTISELLDSNNTHGPEELDDPPVYEAPPDYDEIIKVGMDEEMTRKRRRRSSSASGRRSRMRRSRRPSNTSEVHNPILEVQLPPETDSIPSTSGYTLGRGGNGFGECDLYDSDAYERYSDVDIDDHDLRLASWAQTADRGDFLISSRILETPASPAGPSQSVGAATSSPPPTYDQSNARFFASCSAAQQAASVAAGNARSITEDAVPITLGINFHPSTTVVSVPSNAIITASSSMHPAVTSNESTQTERPWQVFGGSLDDHRLMQRPLPAPLATTQTSYNSLDLDQMQEIDTYLLGYGNATSEENGVSSVSSQETISSNRTSLTQLTLSTTGTFPPTVCLCQSLRRALHNPQANASTSSGPTSSVLSYEMISKHCPACRGQPLGRSAMLLQSAIPAPAGPTYCGHCNRRIVGALGYHQTTRNSNETSGEQRVHEQTVPPTSTMCTCVGKFPSQSNITRTTSAVGTLLATRTFSMDRLDDGGFPGGSYGNDRRSARSSTSAVSRFDAYMNSNNATTNNDRRNET